MNAQTLQVLAVLVTYQLLLLGIGLMVRGLNRDREDFFLGGRRLGPLVAGLSYSASAASAWTLLGFSGITYLLGLSAVWLALGTTLGAAVAWLWFAPRLWAHSRRHGSLTVVDFLLEDSPPGRLRSGLLWSSAAIILISFMLYVAAQFQGVGHSLSVAFELPGHLGILVGAAVIAIYVCIGGFWAVSLTDALQGLLMLLAAVVLPAVGWAAVGGWDGLLTGLGTEGSVYLSLWREHSLLAALGFIFGSLAVGLGAFGQPHLLVRFMALADRSALRRAQLIGIVWYIVVFAGMFLVGLEGRVLFPLVQEHESIFLVLSQSLLSPLLAAVLLAAVLSAIMSTADSQLLVAASVITHDLGLGSRGRTVVSLAPARFAVLLLVALAALVAITVPATIHQRVLFAWVAVGAAFAPLVAVRLAGLRRPTTGTALSAVLSGFGLAVLLYLMPSAPGDVAERLLPFIAGLMVLLLGPQRRAESAARDTAISTEP